GIARRGRARAQSGERKQRTIKGPVMSHDLFEYPAAARGNRLGQILLVLGILFIVLFVFWLAADQEIIALGSTYDDQWFLDKGKNAYWFDDGYSQISFMKEPVYPLFVAACYRLGLPLRLATQVVYLAAAGFLAWC